MAEEKISANTPDPKGSGWFKNLARNHKRKFALGASIIDQVSKWAILFAAIPWTYNYVFVEPGQLLEQHTKDSWSAIYNAWGKSGNGGRKLAVQFLASKGMSLQRINLSRAHITGALIKPEEGRKRLDLRNAQFNEANLEGTKFVSPDLYQAGFSAADLKDTHFVDADLTRANFDGADMKRTNFYGSNLTDVTIRRADMRGSIMCAAIFTGAQFEATIVLPSDWLPNLTALQKSNLVVMDHEERRFNIKKTHHETGEPVVRDPDREIKGHYVDCHTLPTSELHAES